MVEEQSRGSSGVLRIKWRAAAGTGLLLAGILLPSQRLILWLRGGPPAGLQDKLVLGGHLFKMGLVLLGAFVLVLGALPIWGKRERPSETASATRSKSVWLILGIMFSGSLLLGLYRLNSGLWVDEIVTSVLYADIPFGQIVTTYDSQNLHPLFVLLARISHGIFGSPWSLRLPAVLLGSAALLALFFFVREVATRLEALLSVALLAFSYQFIWFSQNARGYTGLLFWTVLSSWLFVRALRKNESKTWILFAFAAALGVYTHFTMGFVIMGQFLIYAVSVALRKNRAKPGWWFGVPAGFVLAGLLIFQLHALILPQIFGRASQEGTRSAVLAWKSPLWTAIEFLRGLRRGFPGGTPALALAVIIFGLGAYDLMRKRPVVVFLLGLPPLVGAVTLKLLGHPLFPRTFFFTIGFMVLVVVRGTVVLGTYVQRRLRWPAAPQQAVGVALAIGLVIVSASSIPRVYGPKQDYQGALRYVEDSRKPGDQVVTVGFNASFPYKNYYKCDWPEAKTLDELNAIRSRSARTWLVYTISLHIESEYADIFASLQRDFTLARAFPGTLHDGTIYVYRADGRPAS
jgi:mannosyltransferase